MTYKFLTTASRGQAKGETMEACKDKDGNFVLFNPAKRHKGAVLADDCTLTRSSERAKELIGGGYSIRMRLRGMWSGAASMIKASRIEVIDLSQNS